MFDGKPNIVYNDTLNAKAEFFFNKSKIMHNNAQMLKTCMSINVALSRYP